MPAPFNPPPRGMLEWPSYVLGRLHRETRETVEAGLNDAGLSLREYYTLVNIKKLDGASQQQVADQAQIDRSDLVKVLDRLEERELITRVRDRSDRRRHVLALTPAGGKILRQATTASRRATGRAFSRLSDDELQSLHRLALKALGEDPGTVEGSGPGALSTSDA